MDLNVDRSNLQDRVDPWGRLQKSPERGAWLGNRGILHDDNKDIVSRWMHTGWVTCLLGYGESTRKGATARDRLFTPGNYSELFFLDEATAFAAGHRPCGQCRNKRYKEFKRAWALANRAFITSDDPPVKEMDGRLQEERVAGAEKKTYEAALGSVEKAARFQYSNSPFSILL